MEESKKSIDNVSGEELNSENVQGGKRYTYTNTKDVELEKQHDGELPKSSGPTGPAERTGDRK